MNKTQSRQQTVGELSETMVVRNEGKQEQAKSDVTPNVYAESPGTDFESLHTQVGTIKPSVPSQPEVVPHLPGENPPAGCWKSLRTWRLLTVSLVAVMSVLLVTFLTGIYFLIASLYDKSMLSAESPYCRTCLTIHNIYSTLV